MSRGQALVLLIVSCALFAAFTYATYKFTVWIFKKIHENK
jgi:hypothetical protein